MHQFNFTKRISESGIYLFTDLDGTLLGHHDYSYEPVLPVLEQLKQYGIPVILNSSKTFAEISQWLKRLNLKPPFITENGGVIYFSTDDAEKRYLLGRRYSEIRAVLHKIRQESGWRFSGFGDWSIEEIMQATLLDYESARKARRREVSEPIRWQDSEGNLQKFKDELARYDLRLLKGGRFYHVMSHHDKASALKWIVEQDQAASPRIQKVKQKPLAQMVCDTCPFVVALGDGENDRQMLEEADLSLILPAQSGKSLNIHKDNAFLADDPAPFGWADSVQKHLLIPLNSRFGRQ